MGVAPPVGKYLTSVVLTYPYSSLCSAPFPFARSSNKTNSGGCGWKALQDPHKRAYIKHAGHLALLLATDCLQQGLPFKPAPAYLEHT